MTRDADILDIEVAPNALGVGFYRPRSGKKVWYEISEWEDTFNRDRIRHLLKTRTTVGFNSLGFDLPVLYMALAGASNQELMDAATRIIQERIPYWPAEREFGIRIPKLDHIDLFNTNPSVMTGLKQLGARGHVKHLESLPFKPNAHLTREEWLEGKRYCLEGDLPATKLLFDMMQEPLDLREAMRKRYDTADLRSKSDAQMGETIVKTEVERIKGDRVTRAVIAEGTTFKFDAPDWMSFKTPLMQQVFDTIKATDFVIGKGGKVSFPKVFEQFEIVFDGMRHALGIGGLHSTEANRAVFSDEDSVLIDGDVAAQYPSIVLKLGLFPKALGKDFLSVYRGLIETRLAAKRIGDKITDKGVKISINGVYGKLGSPYSVLFAPHLMVAVTLTGQLSLLMLIEEAHLRGIPVVSANTDGVVFKCPRRMFDGFIMKDGKATDRLAPSPIQDIIEWWEDVTSFKMEFAEYASMFNQSVNTYVAIKPDGSFKRKGTLANHWRAELPWGQKNTDYDPIRSGLMKNMQMTICADAALGFLLHGIPVEKTIRECRDVREFLTVVNATGGADWRGQYLGNVVRYYWSTNGAPIIKVKPHPSTGNRPKVSKTDGCRPLMTLPDDFAVPDDLDYVRYISEAESILRDIGYYNRETVGGGASQWESVLNRALQIN